MRLLASAFFAVLAAFAGTALAQDVPGRVGRISAIEGSAALYQDPDRGWEDAYVNSPITSRNSVWTDPDSRAEVVVGPIALRLDEASQLDLSLLDDATLDATLERGTVAVRVRHFRAGSVVRLSTPQASFLLRSDGRYRLDADPDRGESRLTVFAGTAGLETANGGIRVSAGQSVVVWGDEGAQYAFQNASTSAFDRWALARDARWVERRAPQFVSYEMTGYEDLDRYGEWGQDPVYGAVWYPTRVQEDWAPYRYGRWTYVRPWGWTWVDTEPWGYAPFHYGRWVHVRDRWAWSPGRRVDRPAWAPALVGFIGGGDWSAGAASGGGAVVGWYPLAPSEPYRPWYSASRAYVTRVNAGVRDVPQTVSRPHVEWNRDRGATVVRRETLIAQRPVQQARVNVASDVLRRAPVATAPTSILPSRDEAHRAQRDVPARSAPVARGAPVQRSGSPAPSAPGAPAVNALARPAFAKPSQAPRAAARGVTPPPPSPLARPAAPIAPAASAPSAAVPRSDRAREALQREEEQRAAQDAQRGRERGAAEAQRGAQEQQRAREAQQQRDRATGEAEQQRQRAAQEQERSTREAAQQKEKAAQEQQRAARDAAQQQQKAAQEQQRAAREAAQQKEKAAQQQQQQQQKAAEEQQRAGREAAQQQQQKAAQEQQKAAQEQQRAAREAAQQQQQQQQKAAQEQQRAAREAAQQQQKAAQDQQRAAEAQKAQPPKAEPQKAEPQKAEPQKAEPRKGPAPGRGPQDERDKRDDEGKRGRGEGG